MTMLSTLCTKVNGKLKMFEKDVFDREFARFGDGEDLELTIESVGEKHTTAQRRFFHGPVLKAFMNMGMGKQEAKDMLALMFIPQEITVFDGSVIRVPGHTSALKKDDYSRFIEESIQCAAEQGQVVEDADEWLRRQASKRRVAA